MKNAGPTDVLQHYARTLQLAAPKEYEAFVRCFDAYATEITVAVTQADQSEVLNFQGRAQAFLHILKTLREAHKSQYNPPSA